jgi:hypothetical protein
MAQISPMRTLPLVILAALAIAGCQTREQAWQKAYNEKRATALRNGWEPARRSIRMAPKPQFARNEPQNVAGGPVLMPIPVIMGAPQAPPPTASQPIIVANTGAAPVSTITPNTFGGSTIVNYGSLPRGVPAVTTVSPTPFGGTRVVNYGYPGYGQPVGVAPSR